MAQVHDENRHERKKKMLYFLRFLVKEPRRSEHFKRIERNAHPLTHTQDWRITHSLQTSVSFFFLFSILWRMWGKVELKLTTPRRSLIHAACVSIMLTCIRIPAPAGVCTLYFPAVATARTVPTHY